jgi:hypothetical protein
MSQQPVPPQGPTDFIVSGRRRRQISPPPPFAVRGGIYAFALDDFNDPARLTSGRDQIRLPNRQPLFGR